jgi:hypothetical protein
MHYGGGVTVRETHGETPYASLCGWLDFGCWSQPVGCTKHLLRINVSVEHWSTGNSSPRRSYVLETLLCPCAGLLKAAGCVVRHS